MSEIAAHRVVRVERKACVVMSADGPHTVPTLVPVAVGDWACVDDEGRVVDILPRSTAIRRLTAGAEAVEQVLAANVDIVGVCAPLEIGARHGRTERLLALAWSSGAKPLLIATKVDLCPSEKRTTALDQFASIASGVEVVPITVTDATTLDPIRSAIAPDRTLVLLGASGVGKTSLVNALLGSDLLATSEVRSDGKGRHATAWRQLVELPGGGFLIDTPGLRAVALVDAQEGVDAVFSDISELATQCRFNDCQHDGEPSCAVTEAIEAGALDLGRFERHQKLQRELASQERRVEARARARPATRWLATAKQRRKGPPASGTP